MFRWPRDDPHFYPLRIDSDGVPVFSEGQVNVFGNPEIWGLQVFRVVVDRDDLEMVAGYVMESEVVVRSVHRYSREERFKGYRVERAELIFRVLMELLGERGKVDERVVELCEEIDKSNAWMEVRRVLKKNGYKGYYNRIPSILKRLGLGVCFCDYYAVQSILREFKRISGNFDGMVWEGRKYFPNLRWVALKMLDLVGVKHEYFVPMILTRRKILVMENIWNKIY